MRPARAFPIHDALLSDLGLANFDGWMDEEADYARIPWESRLPCERQRTDVIFV